MAVVTRISRDKLAGGLWRPFRVVDLSISYGLMHLPFIPGDKEECAMLNMSWMVGVTRNIQLGPY